MSGERPSKYGLIDNVLAERGDLPMERGAQDLNGVVRSGYSMLSHCRVGGFCVRAATHAISLRNESRA